MSDIPNNLRFSKSHEWAHAEVDGTVTVGISDHAQALLGDMVFVELPEVGAEVNATDECGSVESVKAASDVYAPVSGTITAINHNVIENPELVNQAPYGEGWLYKIKPSNESKELEQLLSADEYSNLLSQED